MFPGFAGHFGFYKVFMKEASLLTKENILKFVFVTNSFLVFWYLANSIIGNRSPATSLLTLLSLLTIIPVIKHASACWTSQKWWIIGLVMFGGFNIVSLLGEGVEISDDYDKPAKALAAGLVFLYLMRYGFSHKVVGAAVAIATLVGGGYAVYERFVLDLPRAGMMTNPIRYGYLVVTLGMLCLFYARYSSQRWQQSLFASVGCIGLLGAFCTGTRGVVVILLFLTIFFTFSFLRSGRLSWLNTGALAAVCIAGVLVVSTNTNLFNNYVDKTLVEMNQIENGNLESSIGLRLQMWHVALYLGVQEPLTGAGHDYAKLREKAAGFIEEHHYSPEILVRFGHFHNQFLDSFAKQGVPGVLVWILFLSGALLGMRTRYKYAVLIIVATLAVGGLTEAVLRSSRLYYLAVLGVSIFRCLDYFEAEGSFRRLPPSTETMPQQN